MWSSPTFDEKRDSYVSVARIPSGIQPKSMTRSLSAHPEYSLRVSLRYRSYSALLVTHSLVQVQPMCAPKGPWFPKRNWPDPPSLRRAEHGQVWDLLLQYNVIVEGE